MTTDCPSQPHALCCKLSNECTAEFTASFSAWYAGPFAKYFPPGLRARYLEQISYHGEVDADRKPHGYGMQQLIAVSSSLWHEHSSLAPLPGWLRTAPGQPRIASQLELGGSIGIVAADWSASCMTAKPAGLEAALESRLHTPV